MIVWLSSYPRSGNTYFRMLLNHSYGIETYSQYDDPLLAQLGADRTVGQKRLPDDIRTLKDSRDIFFVKTHGLSIDDNPSIHLVRDGRDALVSYAHFRLSYARPRTRWEAWRLKTTNQPYRYMLRNLILDNRTFGGWSGNVRSWTTDRQRGTTVLVKYEDLISEPIESVSAALAELNLNFHLMSSDIPDFGELQRQWPDFFRKGSSGSWRSEMPPDLQDLFWKRHGDTMTYLRYERQPAAIEALGRS